MAKQCGECRYLKSNDKRDGQLYCGRKNEYKFADSYEADNCSNFFRLGWGYTSSGKQAIKDAENYHKESKPECFITTMVVDILGLDDNCEALQVLRKFRKEFLQKDPQYRDLLFEYDTVGPIIARFLNKDEKRYEIASELYFDYILKAVDYLQAGDVENAVSIYVIMTNILKEKYLSEYILSVEANDSYNQENGGHGRLVLE